MRVFCIKTVGMCLTSTSFLTKDTPSLHTHRIDLWCSLHLGKEVAAYCATHLADIIKATPAYGQGDLGQAMKNAFMQCDRKLKEKEVIEEMKKWDEDEIPVEE